MRKPIIAIKLSPRMYAALVILANAVHAGLTGNLAFTTPLPALTVLQSNIDAVNAALAAWGERGNRGSHATLATLRQAALTLSQTLKSLSLYVQNTAQTASGSDYVGMATMIQSTGFQLANTQTPQGRLQMVQNFHFFASRLLAANQVKLKWKKPLNTTSAGNVKSYKIYKGVNPPVFSTATVYATTTRSSFIDTNNSGATQTWVYFIVPVNEFGDGVPSDAVVVSVLSA